MLNNVQDNKNNQNNQKKNNPRRYFNLLTLKIEWIN